jgi:hypothetical protein
VIIPLLAIIIYLQFFRKGFSWKDSITNTWEFISSIPGKIQAFIQNSIFWFLSVTGLDATFEDVINLYKTLEPADLIVLNKILVKVFVYIVMFGGRFLYFVKSFKYEFEMTKMNFTHVLKWVGIYILRNFGILFVYIWIVDKYFQPGMIDSIQREGFFWFEGNDRFIESLDERIAAQNIIKMAKDDASRIDE